MRHALLLAALLLAACAPRAPVALADIPRADDALSHDGGGQGGMR